MKPPFFTFMFVAALLAFVTILHALEIDPQTRQHSANDPRDWSGGITVRPGPADSNWTATVVPDQSGGDATWLSITPVPPSFLVYAMNENFNAEPRAAYIEFTGGVRFKAVQSGRGSTVSTNAFTIGKDGGTNQLTVTVLPGTFWAATSTASWIRILTGPKGFGNDTVKFAVDPFDGVLPREGTFVVGGNVVRVAQGGIDLTIEPQQAVVGDQLTIVSFNVTALASQTWKPVSLTNWIAVVNPGPGNGNGTVTLSILPNQNYQPRQGSVAIGSNAFLVNQAGNQNPTLSITPTSAVGGDDGAQGRINVIATPGTPWRATSNVPWLQIVAGTDGIGSDTIAFVISPNRNLAPRDAVITVSAAGPLSAPDLRRGLAEHLLFDGGSAGDNLIVAHASNATLKDFPRSSGRNGGQALRFDAGKSWTFDFPEQQTISFWLSSDFSNRQTAVANIGGHLLGTSATERFTLDGQATSFPVAANTWYQVLLRQTGQTFDLFLGGKLLQTLQASNAIVGINPSGNFIGKLDDFRRYVRPLGLFEIDSLFRDESSGQGLAIYQPSPNASQGTLPLIGRVRDDVNNIDLISGRQWALAGGAGGGFAAGAFSYVNGSYTWQGAYQDALNRGGILAWWDSQSELDQILGVLSAAAGKPEAWFNATDEGHEGEWKYRTPQGESLFRGPIPWNSGEPINRRGTENYAQFQPGATKAGAIPGGEGKGYVLRHGDPVGWASLSSSGLSFNGGTAIACRFKGLFKILGIGDSITVVTTDKSLGLSQGLFGPSLDWPLVEPLGDRQHVAALVLNNAASLTVYLDGKPIFSQPTSVKTPVDLSAAMTENGDIRVYGRPLSAQEVASISAELAPRVQYFTLSQAAAVPMVTKTNESVPAAGGTAQTDLRLPTGVPWTAVSTNSWLNFVLGTNARTNSFAGTGPQTVSVFAGENNTTDTRQGAVTIAGLSFTIAQSGRTVTLNPLSAGTTRYGDNVNAVIRETGGAVLVGILPEAGASWTLRYAKPEDASWIVPTPTNAVGNKDVLFAVSPYNSPLASRTAVFNVADKEIRVTQRGYTATVTPSATNFPGDGGQGQVQVTVPTSAFWEAIALSPWITIVTGQNANGSGSVLFKVASNTGPDRFGTIIVAGEVIRLAQAAGTAPTRPRLALIGNKLSLFGAAGTTYIIERSFDLKSWEVVTPVAAKGDEQAANLTIQNSSQSSQFFRARSQDSGKPTSGI